MTEALIVLASPFIRGNPLQSEFISKSQATELSGADLIAVYSTRRRNPGF